MSTFKGTVRKSDLSGGLWLLEADDGTRYQLRGKSAGLVDGQRVVVDGSVAEDAMGIGMAGPTLDVSSWKKA
ncbi:MAG: DUF5818 domain-containing protein [Polyangiaceae bacterium]